MWSWLEGGTNGYTWGFVTRVVLKAALLFAACNLIYAAVYPVAFLGQLSLYGSVLPARLRLPYGENPAQSYNLSVDNLDAMFASHEVQRPKASGEYRVLFIGDSAAWGWFLEPDETYTAAVNAAGVITDDGRRVVAYNLGYPVLSVTKDLILLDRVLRYEPDMVVWMVTAQSMRYEDERGTAVQLAPPVSEWDAAGLEAVSLLDRQPTFWERTLVGDRRGLANLLRLQVYGVAWGATGTDHFIPANYDLRATDLGDSLAWGGFAGPTDFTQDALAFDVVTAGANLLGDVPLVLVNEPIFISDGEHSDLRYNSFYPRWAYDRYRDVLATLAEARGWAYYDWWDVLPPELFTDSPVHVTPGAAQTLGEMLANVIVDEAN